MADIEEIADMARMMRIPIDDEAQYQRKVRRMLEYFGMLDSAGVDGEDMTMREVGLDELREDIHVPYTGDIRGGERDPRGHVRAPGPG